MVMLNSKLSMPRGTIINQTEKQHQRVNINVGGEKHSPYVSTLKNIPDCPLSWITRDEFRGNLDYDPIEDSYFFDRHPGVFSQILNYFQTGKLHCPSDVCGPMFQEELNYWGIDESQMEACCWPNYTAHREIQENLKMLTITGKKQHNCDEHSVGENANHSSDHISSGEPKWKRYQHMVWEMLDEPYSSKLATIFAYISLGFIVLSIITYSLLTIEQIMYKTIPCADVTAAPSNTSLTPNSTINSASNDFHDSAKSCKKLSSGAAILGGFETLFALWFTLEILLRFTFCPNKLEFLKNLSNCVDLCAVIPVYLLLLINNASTILMMLNMVRYLRVFRLFKLLYDLHILGKTLQHSVNQLLVLLIIILVPTIIFSSIAYYAELLGGTEQSKRDFSDIQKGMWWSIITMTTVGYGRVVPASIPGKLIGAVASVIGIIIVSMTASVIGCNFEQYYSVAITQLRIPAKKSNVINVDSNKNTLLAQIQRENGKPASIKSDDSKDSGYGRSPVPPADCEEINSPEKAHVSIPNKDRKKDVIVAMESKQNTTQL